MIHETEALAILSALPYLGPVRIRQLVEFYGSACEVMRLEAAALSPSLSLHPKTLEHWGSWLKGGSWRKNLEHAELNGVELISYKDPRYPKRLLEIPDHPVLLYVKGTLEERDQQSIAIVGTRQATIYGMELAEQTAARLAAMGYTIISGLARGIDTAAHQGALVRGRTQGVIGSGLGRIYPQENLSLAEEISKKGALISEFAMDVPPNRQNFPRRNRIVAAMALATLLVEAPLKSGAMLTMELARNYKRPLFAYPGRVDCDNFKGNHWLIKNGQARLVESADEIAASFENLFNIEQMELLAPRSRVNFSDEERNFLTQLPNQEISIETIAHITELPIMKINALLMSLLLKKAIKEYPGKIYKKVIIPS